MSTNTTNVYLVCPSCKKRGFIEVSDEKKKSISGGILALDLGENIICSHSFIVYLDSNLSVRECIIPDFKVEIPELNIKKELKNCLPERDVFDMDLIKLNLSFMFLVNILKSIFFKQKIVVVSNQEFLHKHIFNLIEDISLDSFKIDLTIILPEEYKINKKNYQNCVVLESNKVLRDDNKVINSKKMKVEKQIVKNFLSVNDVVYCYIMLKNEINKAYELSKKISNYTAKFKETEELNQQIITDFLTEEYNVKISKPYLTFLCEIAKIYFKVNDTRIFYPSNSFRSFWNS